MASKKVTLAEVAAAIQKNGWKKVKNDWVAQDSEGRVIGGCAIGQGAVNLGVYHGSLNEALRAISVFDENGELVTLAEWIVRQNDRTDITVGEIGRLVARRVAALGAMEFDLTSAQYKK